MEQLVENEHRQHLTDPDRVAAWQQLTLEGLTVASIAKRTGTRRDQVIAGLAVASSHTGATLLREGTLTSPGRRPPRLSRHPKGGSCRTSSPTSCRNQGFPTSRP